MAILSEFAKNPFCVDTVFYQNKHLDIKMASEHPQLASLKCIARGRMAAATGSEPEAQQVLVCNTGEEEL